MIDIPYFCPNKLCSNHNREDEDTGWYKFWGTYYTKIRGEVPRFCCKKCGKTFSPQTYSIDYYVKVNIDYQKIEESVHTSSSTRDMARQQKVTTEVIRNRVSRLGRNALAVMAELFLGFIVSESFVADGFESFAYSQYFPHHINILMGADSQAFYTADTCVIRRKGNMSSKQKEMRALLEKQWKADPKGIIKSFRRLIRYMKNHVPKDKKTDLLTDEHKAYLIALQRDAEAIEVLNHKRYSSKIKRDHNNPLFAVNYMDRQIRKDLANHARESVKFAKTISDMMFRLAIYQVYHNCNKVYREKEAKKTNVKHAEMAGVPIEKIHASYRGYFRRRAFLSKTPLDESARKSWFRKWENPLRYANTSVPKFVYM